MMQILGLLGMYFDAAVVFVTNFFSTSILKKNKMSFDDFLRKNWQLESESENLKPETL